MRTRSRILFVRPLVNCYFTLFRGFPFLYCSSGAKYLDQTITSPPVPCAASLESPEYKRNKVLAPQSQSLAADVAVIHRLEDVLRQQMSDTADDSEKAGDKFDDFVAQGVEQATEEQLKAFAASKREYISEVASTKLVWLKLTDTGDKIKNALRREADVTPPFPVVKAAPVESTDKKESTWSDFLNAQDTKWSQRHPNCPQGPPCFCDCRCRGAPPQNFIHPPPPPRKPCPPPPPPPSPTGFTPIN